MNQSLQYEINAVMPAAVETGLFPSLCTIQIPSGALDESGAPTNAWINTDMVDIPCIDAVPSSTKVQATEVKDLQEIMAKAFRHVLLDNYYPELLMLKQSGQVRAMIDGILYEVLGAENDSQGQQTRFECQIVTL